MEQYSFSGSMLRVKADHEVTLPTGAQSIKEEFSDSVVLHRFAVVREIQRKQEGEAFYAWYEIRDYRREIDRVTPVANRLDETKEDTEKALVELAELQAGTDTNIAEIENALIELAEIVGG